MINLSTKYLGLKLKNPVVASASPLTRELDNFRKLEDAGASAIVMHSLFEEQINIESEELDRYLSTAEHVSAEALDMFPEAEDYHLGPEEYLEQIVKAKAAVNVPIIGSLNGISPGGWTRYAKLIQDAGADALELNIYFIPTNPNIDAEQIENEYSYLVKEVKRGLSIPVAVKLSPFFTSLASFAKRLDKAGADGLVLFNRFYQPDFDLEELDVIPTLQLSRSNELRMRLHWVALLYGKIQAEMAITGGVHTAEDVIKSMMAGARVAMTTSALLQNVIDYLRFILSEVREWMEKHEYESIEQMQGSMSQKSVAHPAAYERANYVKVLSSYAPVMR
ncbi:MAG TPA: dihydroorotate dehydrogenase-like protein [Terriglobales bacterium]|nr:dihydroorotate dehydrogenase-like protein [Terriglobales bacterium]